MKVTARTGRLLEAFGEMTLLELSEFVKAFEETFGVTAAVPAPVPGDVTDTDETEPVIEEQTEFTVVLESAGSQKVQVIKAVRTITRLGLKESKDLTDSLPRPVLENAEKAAAEHAKALLEAAGATVTVL